MSSSTSADDKLSSGSDAVSIDSLRGTYERWVRREHRWLLPVLDTVRNVILFLPGRFGDSEVQSEALYTLLNLLSVYHDNILNRPRPLTTELKVTPYTPTVATAATVLTAINYLEVLAEMIAARLYTKENDNSDNERKRWTVIASIESIKAFCRLYLLFVNSGRTLIPPTQADLNMAAARQTRLRMQSESANTVNALDTSEMSDIIDTYVDHGRGTAQPHGNFTLTADTTVTALDFRESITYTPRLSEVVAEILHIIRPVVYTVGRVLCRNDQHKWRVFWLSLLIDITSRILYGDANKLSTAQRAEVSRRMVNWAFYTLRSPFFETYTQYPLSRVSRGLSYVPIVGGIFSNVVDLVFVLQTHYFYTSAS